VRDLPNPYRYDSGQAIEMLLLKSARRCSQDVHDQLYSAASPATHEARAAVAERLAGRALAWSQARGCVLPPVARRALLHILVELTDAVCGSCPPARCVQREWARWGGATRLRVWSRPPAQADALARGKPGIAVAFPLLSLGAQLGCQDHNVPTSSSGRLLCRVVWVSEQSAYKGSRAASPSFEP
jgi:hypothetical protein